MRFAKLEDKLIVTMVLMQYDFKLIDSAGEPIDTRTETIHMISHFCKKALHHLNDAVIIVTDIHH